MGTPVLVCKRTTVYGLSISSSFFALSLVLTHLILYRREEEAWGREGWRQAGRETSNTIPANRNRQEIPHLEVRISIALSVGANASYSP